MRTTVRLDDELYRQLKALAARSGRTVASVIEDSIRRGMRPSTEQPGFEPLPTYGGSGVMPGVELSSNAMLREAMDRDKPLDALR